MATVKAEKGERVDKHVLITRYDPARAARGDMLGIEDVLEILATPLLGIIPESQEVLSAAIAVTVLGEPLHVALVLGTLFVVGGGTLLVSERGGPARMLSLGLALSLGAALLFSVRDNLVRWAARSSDVPGLVAGTASLVSATLVILILVASRPNARERIRLGQGGFGFGPRLTLRATKTATHESTPFFPGSRCRSRHPIGETAPRRVPDRTHQRGSADRFRARAERYASPASAALAARSARLAASRAKRYSQ